MIRRASERASRAGCAPGLPDFVLARTRELLPETPLVPMTYAAILEAWLRALCDGCTGRGGELHPRRPPGRGEHPSCGGSSSLPRPRPRSESARPPRRPTAGSTSCPSPGRRAPDGAFARAAAIRAAGARPATSPSTWDSASRRTRARRRRARRRRRRRVARSPGRGGCPDALRTSSPRSARRSTLSHLSRPSQVRLTCEGAFIPARPSLRQCEPAQRRPSPSRPASGLGALQDSRERTSAKPPA